MLRVGNDPDPTAGGPISGAFGELIRLQTEFQARLAEETLRYLRSVQGAIGPSVPGTFVLADEQLRLHAQGAPGGSVTLRLEVENRQRVHCVVTLALSPLLDAGGATWFPSADASPPSVLLPPGAVNTIALNVALPVDLPPGSYRGALLLQGFHDRGLPVTIDVRRPATSRRRKGAAA